MKLKSQEQSNFLQIYLDTNVRMYFNRSLDLGSCILFDHVSSFEVYVAN